MISQPCQQQQQQQQHMSIKEVNNQYHKFDKINVKVGKDLDLVESGQCEQPQEVCFFFFDHLLWRFLVF